MSGAGDLAAPWTRFWATGAPHSCAGSFGERYGGAIGDWWDVRFSSIGPTHRVLDIGTGGGPLPRLLVERAGGELDRMPWIAAVDLAVLRFAWIPDPAPAWCAKLDLRTGVRAEALPVASGCIDLVCSQFGIEYAQRDAAINEVLRVLAADGSAAFVMHAAESIFAEVAREEAMHLRWLLGESGWVAHVEAMLEPMVRSRSPEGRALLAGDRDSDAVRRAFNATVRTLASRAAASRVPDALDEAREAAFALFGIAAEQGLDAARLAGAEWATGLADALSRQLGLIEVALDDVGVAGIAGRFRAAGRPVHVDALRHDDGRIVAWGLCVGPVGTAAAA